MPVSPVDLVARLAEAIELLESVARDPDFLIDVTAEQRGRLLQAVANFHMPNRAERRRMSKARAREHKNARVREDDELKHETGIRKLRRKPVFHSPNIFPPPDKSLDVSAGEEPSPSSVEPQHCYVCKVRYSKIHHFYDQLCPDCADLNYQKRTELADLHGRTALLTGGRVKIGYQAGVKLLRCGAKLIVTTRFPQDAASRYANEPDFTEWAHRLSIFGLDLRHTPSVEGFCQLLLEQEPRLDFIINNACQTVRRPPEFYAHMMEQERAAFAKLPAALASSSSLTGLVRSAELSQVRLLPEDLSPSTALFPQGQLDQDLQQIDLRSRN